MRGKQIRSLGQEDPLEKEMATQSRVLAWRIPLKRSLEGPQSAGPQKSQDMAEQPNKKEGRRGQVFSDQGSHGSLLLPCPVIPESSSVFRKPLSLRP